MSACIRTVADLALAIALAMSVCLLEVLVCLLAWVSALILAGTLCRVCTGLQSASVLPVRAGLKSPCACSVYWIAKGPHVQKCVCIMSVLPLFCLLCLKHRRQHVTCHRRPTGVTCGTCASRGCNVLSTWVTQFHVQDYLAHFRAPASSTTCAGLLARGNQGRDRHFRTSGVACKRSNTSQQQQKACSNAMQSAQPREHTPT